MTIHTTAKADTATVRVNGRDRQLDLPTAQTTLLDWLRGAGLTGAKEGCAEGECGACAVLVARPDRDDSTRWRAINACLLPAAALDGQELVTAEGLGSPADLHPVQHELAVRGGSQCGYCTPGFVCSMAAEFYRPDRCPSPDRDGTGGEEREHGPNGFDLHALSGNLCRCTGYRPIRDAAYALGSPAPTDPLARRRDRPAPATRRTRLAVDGSQFWRPTDLAEALDLLEHRPGATVLAGSTDLGVEVNLRGSRPDCVVAVDQVPELREFSLGPHRLRLGASLTLSELEQLLEGRVPVLDRLFDQFASRLIRNGATIGGNLGTGSPIGDTPPVLLALDATVVLASRVGDREVPLADYFTGYRQSVREPDELIRAVDVPLPVAGVTDFHKIAKRRFDDISSVAVGYALDTGGGVVRSARIGLGGVAATPIRALATEQALVGEPWTEETVRRAADVLSGEGTPMDDHRASSAYRAAMLGQSLLRLHATHPTTTEEHS